LLNFEPVMAAMRIILDPADGNFAKHVTLSTSGIVPGMNAWRRKRCGRNWQSR